jgi:DNA repair protein RadC
MSISNWPVDERPREKLLLKGAQALSDSELLAIFLRTGVPGMSAVEMGRYLLQHFGGLRQFLDAPVQRMDEVKGMGPAKYVQFQAALEVGQRYLQDALKRGDAMTSPDAVKRYLLARMRGLPHEVFVCLLLDSQHRLITCEELFRGTIDGASVYPREVVKQVLASNAAAVILAHNHPSGVAEPSQADRAITDRLVKALALVDVRVLDHIVVGDTDVVSFAERGLI